VATLWLQHQARPDDDERVTEANMPARGLARDGRRISQRKLRNTVPAVLAVLGATAGSAIIISNGLITRLPDGHRLPWTDWIFPLALVAVMVGGAFGYARCFLRIDSSSLTIQNPLHRHVLTYDDVQSFGLERRAPLPYVCVCHGKNGRDIPCVAITNGNEATRRLVADLNEMIRAHVPE
jgi:hypothetical protein